MKVQEETGAMTTVLQENLSGMKVVKSYGARAFEESKFNARAAAIARLTYSATRLFASQGSLMTFIFTSGHRRDPLVRRQGSRRRQAHGRRPDVVHLLHGPACNASQDERVVDEHSLPRLIGPVNGCTMCSTHSRP